MWLTHSLPNVFFFQVLPASFPILSLLQESNLRRSRENRKLPQVSVSDLQFYRILCVLLQMIYIQNFGDAWGVFYSDLFKKNVVGENDEWQLSNKDCTTERNCGCHIWYAKTMSSSRGAKLILPYERPTGSGLTPPFTRNLEI